MKKRLIFVLQFIFLTFFAFGQEGIQPQDKKQIILPERITVERPYTELKDVNLSPLDKAPKDELNIYPSPAMDLKTEVRQIGWVSSEDFFTVTDEQAFVMNIPKNTREEIETEEGYISYVETAWNSARENDLSRDIFTLTNTDRVSIRKLPLNIKYPSKNLYTESPVRCATISPDGAFVATGHENGKIVISMQLFLTKTIYNTDFYIESKGINALRFSPNSDLLAVISREGMIDIWDMHDSSVVDSMKTIRNSRYPVYFSNDSQHIVSAEDKNTVYIREFDGTVVDKVSCENEIKTYHLSDEGKYLFELSQNNNIYVYNMETKKLLGYIPYFSKSEILDFAFSEDYKTILVAHKAGIIFILKTEDVFLAPEAPQPRLGTGSYYGGTGAGQKNGNQIITDIGVHNIDIRFELSKPSDPFIITMTPQIAYMYSPLFKKFYFGGMIEFPFNIPKPDFPYTYIDLDTARPVHHPYIMGPRISGLFGYFLKPWKNIDIAVFAEGRIGGGFYTFYFPNYGTLDKYPSFEIELQTGFAWKQLLLILGGVYDYRLGPSISGGIGWRIRMGGG